jgi:hypothetical protein
MMVMMIASTPSLNASSRPLFMPSPSPADWGEPSRFASRREMAEFGKIAPPPL